MVVEQIVYFLLISEFSQVVTGISNKEKLIDEEFHRAAELPENTDQAITETLQKDEILQRDLRFLGLNSKYHQHSYAPAYAPVGPDNLGYIYGQTSPHNIRPQYVHEYGEEIPHYGSLHTGAGSVAYGTSGGGQGAYGHSGSGGIYPYDYGHSGSYGYSGGGGESYGHGGGGHSYEHEGGYGLSGIGQYLHKKLSLKKLILPLAGLALIAAAGALSTSNPVLLQLGTISSTARGKRSLEKKKIFPMNPFVRPEGTDKK